MTSVSYEGEGRREKKKTLVSKGVFKENRKAGNHNDSSAFYSSYGVVEVGKARAHLLLLRFLALPLLARGLLVEGP